MTMKILSIESMRPYNKVRCQAPGRNKDGLCGTLHWVKTYFVGGHGISGVPDPAMMGKDCFYRLFGDERAKRAEQEYERAAYEAEQSARAARAAKERAAFEAERKAEQEKLAAEEAEKRAAADAKRAAARAKFEAEYAAHQAEVRDMVARTVAASAEEVRTLGYLDGWTGERTPLNKQ